MFEYEFDLVHESAIKNICVSHGMSCQIRRSSPGTLRSLFVTIDDEALNFALAIECKNLNPIVSPYGGWK